MTHKERETQAAHVDAQELASIKAERDRARMDYRLLSTLHDSLKTKHANLEVDHKKLQEYVEKVNKGQMKSILNEKI